MRPGFRWDSHTANRGCKIAKCCGILCGMGNKDARRREVKKPKKKVPKPEPNRPAITFVNKPTDPS